MNLGELRTIVSAKLRLTNDVQGDQPLLDTWANLAVLDVLQKTRCTQRFATLELEPGVSEYEYPADIMSVVLFKNQSGDSNGDMIRKTLVEIEELRQATANPQPPVMYYASMGSDAIAVYPTPNSDEILRLCYIPLPTSMTSPSHDPSEDAFGGIPKWAHKAIEYYMLREGADYDNHAPSKSGEAYDMRYKETLGWINKMITQQGGSLLPEAVLSRPQGTRAPHDPSTDIW